MSQKPRSGAQARTPLPPKVSAQSAPVEDRPIETAETVESGPEAIVEPIAAQPTVEAEPTVTEAIRAEPSVIDEPVTIAAETVSEMATEAVAPIAAAPEPPATAAMPTQPSLMQGMTKMMKSTEDFMAFGQANMEAFVKSGQIWAAGVQELTKQMAACAKESFDESVSTFKAISTAKSVKEALDLQSTFAKTAFEKAMAESNKLTDASIKLTEQALAPLTARMTDAVETFGKAA